MHEKAKELMGLILAPFDQTIDNLASTLAMRFQEGFGVELPKEAAEGISIVEAAGRARRDEIENPIAVEFEKNFTDTEFDELLTFYRSAAYKKMTEASPALMSSIAEITSVWIRDTMEGIEPQLTKLLGGPEVNEAATPVTIEPENTEPTAA